MSFFRKRKLVEIVLDDPNEGGSFTADCKLTILEILRSNGVAHPSRCRIGNCGTCVMQVVAGEVKNLTDPSYVLSAVEIGDRFFLPCQTRVASDILVVRRVQRPQGGRASESENIQ